MYWFTLHESELICHAKRDKSVVSEIITLQGSSVVCPCYHDKNVNIEVITSSVCSKEVEVLLI